MRKDKTGKQEGDALLSWQLGAVKITSVVEMLMPFPYDPQGVFLKLRYQ